MFAFKKRYLSIALATFLIGIGSAAAIWGVSKFLRRSTSVNGQVVSYLFDDHGDIAGLLLTTGDQLHFGPRTGSVVAAQINVGDSVTATGHAGKQSKYGRELRVSQISANGRTITEANDPPPPAPHGPHPKPGPKADYNGPRDGPQGGPAETSASPGNQPGAPSNLAAPTPPTEISNVVGTIKTHLVNGQGDINGLILSSGEQVRFSPRVGELVVTAENSQQSEINVSGEVIKKEKGTLIRASQITVGNQTIALNH